MKRLHWFALGLAIIAVAGCNLTLPQELTVRTDTGLTVPAGSRTFELSEFFDAEQALDDLSAGVDGLYRVPADPGQPLRLALEQELANIAVDDFAGSTLALDTISEPVDVSYTVPDISSIQSVSNNLDPIPLPGTVSVPAISLTAYELNGSATVPTDSITTTGFTSVTFAQGTMTANVMLSNATGGMTVRITNAEIRVDDGNTGTATGALVTTAINQPIVTSGESLIFDLATVQLQSAFELSLTLDVAGGAGALDPYDVNMNFSFSGNTTLSGAEGVDFTQQLTGFAVVPIDSALGFQTATVGAGGGDITLGIALPAGWTGITFDPQVTLLQNSSTIAGPATLSPAPFKLNLDGTTFTASDITVDYVIDVTGTGATFALDTTAGADEVTTDVTASITEFSEITLNDADYNFSETLTQTLDASITSLVESASFTNPVISISLDNQLPVPVTVDITSSTLSGGVPVTFTSSAIPATWPAEDPAGLTPITWDLAPATLTIDMPEINIDVVVTLDDGNTGDGILTLTNVTPGTPYSLTGSVDATFDITELVVNTDPADPLAGQFPPAADPGIDFSAVGNFLPPSVEFQNIESFLNMVLDSSSGTLDVNVFATYGGWTPGGSGSKVDLVGTSGIDPLVTRTPESIATGATANIPVDLNQILNAAPSDLYIHYIIEAMSITLNPGAGQNVLAGISSDIPLQFNSDSARGSNEITDDTGNPIVPAMEGDILGRTGIPDEDQELEDLIRFAREVRLTYELTNDLGLGVQADIVEPADPVRGLSEFRKTLELKDGPGTLTMTTEDIERIASDPLFEPEVHLLVPDGVHSLLTGGSVGLSATMEVDTDVEYTFPLTGGQE